MMQSEVPGILLSYGVRPSAFSIGDGVPDDDTYVIERGSNGWAVYYSERGSGVAERVFSTEEAACDELVERVLRDPSARTTWPTGPGRQD
jgi:hypothetical protein